MSETEDLSSRLASEAERVCAAGALGRSDLLGRLFAFLLERSIAGQVPKEIEVAREVFGKGSEFDMLQDSSVRVYVHRLRRKIDDHYAATPPEGERLVLPRGEYRVTLAPAVPEPDPSSPADPSPPPDPRRPRAIWVALAAALLALNAAGWWYAARSIAGGSAYAAAAGSRLWAPLATGDRPTVIVLGDYYIFGESDDGMNVARLVREFRINSRPDLDDYLMLHPDRVGRFQDLDLHYLPVSTGAALRELLPLVDALAQGRGGERPRIIAMSELTPDLLKSANIVYVGYLSGLGAIRNPLFAASNFAIGASYDELIDERSGRHFMSDWSVIADGRSPEVDYGYVAGLDGPSGNRIIIVAGTRDAAVMQAAESAADPAQLAQIAAKVGAGSEFEALYRVQTMGNTNFGKRLELAYPLRPNNVWRSPGRDAPAFPDEMDRQRLSSSPR